MSRSIKMRRLIRPCSASTRLLTSATMLPLLTPCGALSRLNCTVTSTSLRCVDGENDSRHAPGVGVEELPRYCANDPWCFSRGIPPFHAGETWAELCIRRLGVLKHSSTASFSGTSPSSTASRPLFPPAVVEPLRPPAVPTSGRPAPPCDDVADAGMSSPPLAQTLLTGRHHAPRQLPCDDSQSPRPAPS